MAGKLRNADELIVGISGLSRDDADGRHDGRSRLMSDCEIGNGHRSVNVAEAYRTYPPSAAYSSVDRLAPSEPKAHGPSGTDPLHGAGCNILQCRQDSRDQRLEVRHPV